MNLLLVALVSVILATGVFNTEPEISEGKKKNRRNSTGIFGNKIN